jgi:hypothetical protein
MMLEIDQRIDRKIFVADSKIYERNELYDNFPFFEFGIQPESVFAQQEVGVFAPWPGECEPEFVARDVGSAEKIMPVESILNPYRTPRNLVRIVKTKFYIGKDNWKDFLCVHGAARGLVSVAAARRSGGNPLLLEMLKMEAPRPNKPEICFDELEKQTPIHSYKELEERIRILEHNFEDLKDRVQHLEKIPATN